MTQADLVPNPDLDLVLERVLDVPPSLVWEAWTKPEHLVHWFCPPPWKTIEAEIDLRPGGKFATVMQSPEGEKFPGVGCYLEVEINKKLVWTDALGPGYRPNKEPYFTAVLLLEDLGGKTKYTVIAKHTDQEKRDDHKAKGFFEGWGMAADQLVAYMKSIQ